MRAASLVGLFLSPALLVAQEAPDTASGEPVTAAGSWGVDFASQYFFRGIQQENQGVIAQPWLELGYGLYTDDGALRSLDLTFGLWNSLHDGPTGSANGAMWYESDFYVGLTGAIGDRVTCGATYTAYHSPNGRFGTVEELALSVGFDDDGLLGETFGGLQPSLVVAFELSGQADGGADLGTYAQLGIEPGFDAGKVGDLELTVSVPVTLGFSLGDYYEFATGSEDSLGFVDVGVAVSSPLDFMPSRAGAWDGTLALHFLMLGDNNEALNSGEDSELIVSFGLSTSF
ncbi:MAG: hypothetical protein AB7O97_18755 [Planctomycetota bacterium]